MSTVDALATLNTSEITRLRQLAQGAKFSGAARNELAEIAQAKGLSDGDFNHILRLIQK